MTAVEVRQTMGSELCGVADALRATFSAKLVWLETPTMTIGERPEEGVPTTWRGDRRSNVA
jgi:hypothetical protein